MTEETSPFDWRYDLAVQTVMGFIGLAQWEDAWNELEKLLPEEKASMHVLNIRLGLGVSSQRYEEAAQIAETMLAEGDNSPNTWLLGATAIRRARSPTEAKVFLEGAKDLLKDDPRFHFSMACFECQIGDIKAMKRSLTRCFDLDQTFRLLALDEEDLTPFW